jgi:hypothetical protein
MLRLTDAQRERAQANRQQGQIKQDNPNTTNFFTINVSGTVGSFRNMTLTVS